jgi:ATP-dependent helicase/nuclease subunit A
VKVRVASAGTGKTTSLVLRALELILSGTPLRRLAGVTFTRAAADELRSRVAEGVETLLATNRYLEVEMAPSRRSLLEEARRELKGATLTTIHGFMGGALRLCAPGMGLDPDFAVIGEWEAQALFEEELRSFLYIDEPAGLEHPLEGAGPLLRALFKKRSLAERYLPAPGEANAVLLGLYAHVYERFLARLGGRLLSPAEIERRALQLVASPQSLRRLRERYHYVLVDEFQDVNPLQGRFFEALQAGGLKLEVVGDPKQSIYAFRHADVAVFRRALKRGKRQKPLNESRRHARVILRFLNHLTDVFAARELGFSPDEAPAVHGVGAQQEKLGRLECHWVVGSERVDLLRAREAEVLAGRLKSLSDSYPCSDMAVLARSYQGLATIEGALRQAGLPCVLVQGRGYFERLELRDLYHALCVSVEPGGLSLAAWLRGPFAGLTLADVDRLLGAQDPLALLEASFPDVHRCLETTTRLVRESSPLDALKALIRTPFIGGKRYVDGLDARARENVDALLFTVAREPPGELELLLSRLELLSHQAEAGDVPQSGEGVRLLTVHRAKGLEWPVVAIFDAGRKAFTCGEALYVEPEEGLVAVKDTPDYDRLHERQRERERQEDYRLLYVAASRARDVLLISGSVKAERPAGWAAALDLLDIGASGRNWERPELVVKRWPYRAPAKVMNAAPCEGGVELPPWLDRRFAPEPLPPLFSPSALKEDEPLPFPDPEEGERLPGRARAVGTLVHYAIGQGWSADHPEQLYNLEAQEVMFPFDDEERREMMAEVAELLRAYRALLGREIPWPRDEDYPELPLALPRGSTVWQGVIDRLYRVGESWYLEDYKTDHEIKPERYHVQLGVYLQAVNEVLGVLPEPRLVYLRYGRVVRLEASEVLAAMARVEGS